MCNSTNGLIPKKRERDELCALSATFHHKCPVSKGLGSTLKSDVLIHSILELFSSCSRGIKVKMTQVDIKQMNPAITENFHGSPKRSLLDIFLIFAFLLLMKVLYSAKTELCCKPPQHPRKVSLCFSWKDISRALILTVVLQMTRMSTTNWDVLSQLCSLASWLRTAAGTSAPFCHFDKMTFVTVSQMSFFYIFYFLFFFTKWQPYIDHSATRCPGEGLTRL